MNDELNQLEQEKRNMKLKLQTEAEKDLDALRTKLEMDNKNQA